MANVSINSFVFWQVESENECTSQMRRLIDQISMQQGQIVALEGVLIFTYVSTFPTDDAMYA